MTEQDEMVLEAVAYLTDYDPDDWDDRFELIETLGNFLDAVAGQCGAADFADFRADPNVMRTMQWLNYTRDEYRKAQTESFMPEPGLFALLHAVGLDLAKSLPRNSPVRDLMPVVGELYDIFRAMLAESTDEGNAE